MKRLSLSIVTAAAVALLLVFVSFRSAGPARADQRGTDNDKGKDEGHPCSLVTLKGNYLYAQDGFNITVNNDRVPFAQTGREHFDGKGAMSGIFSASTNGVITKGHYAGTYAVNSDCSGSVTFTDNTNTMFHYDIYLEDTGKEFGFVQTDHGVVTAAFERRQN